MAKKVPKPPVKTARLQAGTDYTVDVSSGFPRVTIPETSPIHKARWDAVCPVCLSDGEAFVGIDKNGGHFIYCHRCRARVMYGRVRGASVAEAWQRILKSPNVRHQLVQSLSMQMPGKQYNSPDHSDLVPEAQPVTYIEVGTGKITVGKIPDKFGKEPA